MLTSKRLLRIFDILLATFGKRYWWPGDSALEIVVGAILTQNTSWKNVEKAIKNMKQEGLLDAKKLRAIDADLLATIIRPAGFFNVKARRLKNFTSLLFFEEFHGSLDGLATLNTHDLRELLLSVNGIGQETADSIMLYVFNRPLFVVDSYTKRFLRNHNLYTNSDMYRDVQKFFMDNLPADAYKFNEFHALIVCLCQTYCRKVPSCATCPLAGE